MTESGVFVYPLCVSLGIGSVVTEDCIGSSGESDVDHFLVALGELKGLELIFRRAGLRDNLAPSVSAHFAYKARDLAEVDQISDSVIALVADELNYGTDVEFLDRFESLV